MWNVIARVLENLLIESGNLSFPSVPAVRSYSSPTMVTRLCVLCLSLVVPAGSTAATEPIDFRSVLKMFQQRDLVSLQNLRPQALEDLPLEERNQIALAATESLSIEPYIKAIGNESLYKHFTKPPALDSPLEAECRKQWGINGNAAEMLRHLAEKRLINDPQILPYLIAGLDHPDRFQVGQKCFYALENLTRRESGAVYWARLVNDEKRHAKISKWWRAWWKSNRKEHPVFDTEIEEQARATVLHLASIIGDELKPRFPELSLFETPKSLPLRWQRPLFYVEYNPWSWSLTPGSFNGIHRDRLPWILISCRFQSEGLNDTSTPEDRLQPPQRIRSYRTTCYSERIQGSDLLVEVQAASENEAFMAAIRSVFAEKFNTQPNVRADANSPGR